MGPMWTRRSNLRNAGAIISSITPPLVQGWPVSAPDHWPRVWRLTLLDTLLFPDEQPFNTLHKLPTDPKQDIRPNLHLAMLHRGGYSSIWLD